VTTFLFDVDGVLSPCTHLHEDAYREVLVPFGIKFDYDASVSGRNTSDVIADAFARRGVALGQNLLRGLVRQKQALVRKLGMPIAPYAVDILFQLNQKYTLGIATSGSRERVVEFLDWHSIRRYFACVVTAEDVVHGKPAPDVFLRAASQLGVSPEQCCVIEDSPAGVRSAKAAGTLVCAIEGTVPADRLAAAGADWVVSNLKEFYQLSCVRHGQQ
jgi:HAD superfamily hydrolase (TIGR01509 family)